MNWKTCFLPLLLAAVMLGSVTAFADGEPVTPETTEPTEMETRETEGSWNNNIYTDNQGIVYQLNGNFITVTGTSTNFSGGEITIPTTIEKGGISYPVTGVGDWAFWVCSALESVTFSGNADSIGDYAFYSCDALESVTFSDDVGSIRGLAFYSCDALENVTFSGNVGNIEGHAFWNCDSLDTVTFSGNADSIGDYAFYSCDALKTLTFSGDVGNIENNAFERCRALTTLTFSGDVDSIESNAFAGCDALKTIYVPSMSDEKIAMIQAALKSSELQNVQIVQPEQPSDPATDPSTPSVPSTGTTGSASNAVQQLEATERYNFWMDVKSDLRAAGDGRTVRVYVPADYTNMPASVMETIRTLGKEITIDLRWNGQRLLITPQTALKRPARKAFWTFDALCEVYAR